MPNDTQDSYDETAFDAPNPAPSTPTPEASPAARDPETGRFAAKPEPPKHTDYWRRRAAEVSLSQADLDALDPSELRDEVRHRELASLTFTRNGVPPETPHSPRPAETSVEDDEISFGIEDEAQYTEGLIPSVKKYIKELRAELKQLKSQTGSLTQREMAREASERERQFDAAFAALGAGFEKFVGKGTAADLKDTPEMQKRVAIVRAAGVEPTDSAATMQRKIKAVAELLHSPAATNAYDEPPNLTRRQQEFVDGVTEKPTSRTKAELPMGVARAKKTFVEGVRSLNGQGGDEADDYEF